MKKLKSFFLNFLVTLLALQGVMVTEVLTARSAEAADPTPNVVINEVMWMGSTANGSDEWIELRNTTNSVVDLSGWQLTHTASGGGTLTIPAEKSIPANGYFLISNYNENSASSILNVAPDWVVPGIVLSNTCSQIDLVSSGGSEAVVDSMGCASGGDYYFPASSTTKHSLERNIIIASGLVASSWHESVGFANLDTTAAPDNLATPKFTNDVTSPLIGQVTDDGQFTANPLQLHASWTGFVDPESGIVGYKAGVGTAAGINDTLPLTDVALLTDKTFDFSESALVENTTYYINIVATNGVGLVSSMASSNGITVNTVNPATPTGLTVADTPSDNGGSVKATWIASISPDTTSYQLNYRKAGDSVWTVVVAGAVLEKTITGLSNAPTSYEFTVEAIDFNSQHSLPSAIVTGQALDNLVPIIDANKIVVAQNKPGSADTVSGLAGASNEVPVTVTVLSAAPGDPAVTVIGSVMSNADGSFPAIGIGDNQYGFVWLQLTDGGSNLSLPLKLSNDIVGPAAPILNKAVANCASNNCRVNLEWLAGSVDTASYKVVYTVDGTDHTTFEVTATSMTLDLASGKNYQFKVIGYDQYGNPSTPSNVFSIALTKGVKTTVVLTNGQPVTTTEAISGALEVTTAPVVHKNAPAQFVPKVKAAEPTVEVPTPAQQPLVADSSSSHDWIRIFVVVILLLIIAGSFYALSRSIKETPEESLDQTAPDQAPPASKEKLVPGAAKRRRTRRRRRR